MTKILIFDQIFQFLTLNQDPYLSRSVNPLSRSARIGPLSPHQKYFVYIDVAYKGAPNTIEKSLNYYIEGDRIYDYISNPRRPLGVKDFIVKPGYTSPTSANFDSIIYSFKTPLIDRNHYFDLRTFHIDSENGVLLNPGKVKSPKCGGRSRCEYKYSGKQQFIEELAEDRNTSFSSEMIIYDFRNVDSIPSYGVYLAENEERQFGSILPPCTLIYNNKEKSEIEDLKIEWSCPQKVRLQIGRNRTFGKTERTSKTRRSGENDFIPFLQQLEKAKLTGRLKFELRWIFRTELFQKDGNNWETQENKIYSYAEIRAKNLETYLENGGTKRTFSDDYGTQILPFSIPWFNDFGRTSNKCDRTFAQIRMFIENSKNSDFELSSNYSDYISFDAPHQSPIKQPETTLYYNHKFQRLRVRKIFQKVKFFFDFPIISKKNDEPILFTLDPGP